MPFISSDEWKQYITIDHTLSVRANGKFVKILCPRWDEPIFTKSIANKLQLFWLIRNTDSLIESLHILRIQKYVTYKNIKMNSRLINSFDKFILWSNCYLLYLLVINVTMLFCIISNSYLFIYLFIFFFLRKRNEKRKWS